MKDIDSFDYTPIKDFIQAVYADSLELGAFVSSDFSVDSFMNRVKTNGYELTFTLTKANSNKFERIVYSPAYRRNSSSGKIAKTSIVFYRFDKELVTNELGIETVRKGDFFKICWPVHLMNKKDIIFDLVTGDIWLASRHPDYIKDVHVKTTVKQLIEMIHEETMGSIYFIVNKTTHFSDSKMKKRDFKLLPAETIKMHLTLCDMVVV